MINREFRAEDFDFRSRRLSYSTIKHILKSPLHFAFNWFTPREKTDAMQMGSAFDCLLFDGEDAFEERYLISNTPVSKSSKDACIQSIQVLESVADPKKLNGIKKTVSPTDKVSELREYIDQLSEIQSRSIISREKYDLISALVDRFKSHRVAGQFYNSLVSVQRRMVWKDKKTGFELVGYLDGESDFDGRYVVWDLKLTNDASTDGFMRNAMKFGYHIQAAAYRQGYIQATGRIVDFYFIAVEPDTGAINVMRCDSNIMELGQHDYRNALDRIKYCKENEAFNEDYLFLKEDNNSLTAPYWELKRLE